MSVLKGSKDAIDAIREVITERERVGDGDGVGANDDEGFDGDDFFGGDVDEKAARTRADGGRKRSRKKR